MNIRQFKQHAKVIEDNTKNAADAWSKSWGLDFWFNLWAFQTYQYGRFTYKSGRVNMRHYGYTETQCFIDNQPVTLYKFKKELAKEPEPRFTQTAHRNEQRMEGNETQTEIDFN